MVIWVHEWRYAGKKQLKRDSADYSIQEEAFRREVGREVLEGYRLRVMTFRCISFII